MQELQDYKTKQFLKNRPSNTRPRERFRNLYLFAITLQLLRNQSRHVDEPLIPGSFAQFRKESILGTIRPQLEQCRKCLSTLAAWTRWKKAQFAPLPRSVKRLNEPQYLILILSQRISDCGQNAPTFCHCASTPRQLLCILGLMKCEDIVHQCGWSELDCRDA